VYEIKEWASNNVLKYTKFKYVNYCKVHASPN